MDNRFQVMEQTAPTRCEICHQADRFDPYTETCMRCQALILTHNLPQAEAERYQRRQQAGLAVPRDTSVPLGDLFRVLPEAVKLCQRNYLLLFSIIAAVELPLGLFRIMPSFLPHSMVSPFMLLPFVFFSLMASMVLSPIASGAVTKAILDRFRGETASFNNSYQFILDRGFRYILTAILGGFYQVVGLLLCFVGALYTVPRGLFTADVAIVEEKYYLEAVRRSKQLAKANSSMLLLFVIMWSVLSWTIMFFVEMISMMFIWLAGPALAGIITTVAPLISVLLMVALSPYFFTTKLLLYFHIRTRTDEVSFPVETAKKEVAPQPAQ